MGEKRRETGRGGQLVRPLLWAVALVGALLTEATPARAAAEFEIYVMRVGASGTTRLTDHPGDDDEPAWSPDRTRIAFESARDGNGEVYVMRADGSGPTNLTNHRRGSDSDPAWSPEGTMAFSSDRE